MIRIVIIVTVLLVVCSLVPASGHRHRRHHHHRHGDEPKEDVRFAEEKKNATETLKDMLQTSPKDALIVTKRRYLRKDWCQSQPLIQRIGQDQCLTTTILNRFCYGQCNSFFIPKNQLRNDPGQQQVVNGQDESASATLNGAGIAGTAKAFRSCAVCQPKKTSWVTVTLKCPSLVPNIRRRRVLVINQCRCMQPDSTPTSDWRQYPNEYFVHKILVQKGEEHGNPHFSLALFYCCWWLSFGFLYYDRSSLDWRMYYILYYQYLVPTIILIDDWRKENEPFGWKWIFGLLSCPLLLVSSDCRLPMDRFLVVDGPTTDGTGNCACLCHESTLAPCRC